MQIPGKLAIAMLKLTKRVGEDDSWNIFAISEQASEGSAVASPQPRGHAGCDLLVSEVGSQRGRLN